MSELSESVTYTAEEVQPLFDTEQPYLTEGSAAPAASEMPNSHPDVDIGSMTVGGLIKACPHYAKLAEASPELARTQAAEVVQRMQEREVLRERGMGAEAIRKQGWSGMSRRHKEKLVPEKTGREPEVEVVSQLTTEQLIAPADTERVSTEVESVIKERPSQQKKPPVTLVIREAAAPLHKLTEQYVDEAKVIMPSPVDKLLPVQDIIAIEGVHDHTTHLSEQLGVAVESRPLMDHRLSTGPEASAAVEKPAIIDTFLYDNVQPEQLPPGGSTDVTEALENAELMPLLFTAEPSVESSEMTGLVDVAIVNPEQAALPEQQTWDDILEKEPPVLFDTFTEALQSLLTPIEEIVIFDETIDTDEPVVLVDTIQDLLASPAIAVTVSERLTDLDVKEKEAAAPLLKEIIEVVHANVPAGAGIEPEVLETVQAELKELVVALFEQLGIIYESEDVEQFMRVLLRPEFQPPHSLGMTQDVNLEHDGTHEGKNDWLQASVALLVSAKKDAKHALGMFVLLRYATQQTAFELAA